MGLAVLAALLPAQAPRAAEADPSALLFEGRIIPELTIELDPDAAESLRRNPRVYVAGRLVEKGRPPLEGVAFKLKGAAGSFRELDDQPAFTVRVDRPDPERRFHGLARFHLNNSVQDATLLHEHLGSRTARAAGVPAPRVGHARVTLNGRVLGIYVLKEPFDRAFLERHFGQTPGVLYDGGFCQDLDAPLERDLGPGDEDRADLALLLSACREPDPARRRALLAERLDIPRFLSFVAVEALIGHWDGYSQNRNNYRLLFTGPEHRAVFLPHGMDQLFGDADANILAMPTAIAARAVLRDPEFRAAYRKRLAEIVKELDPPKAWLQWTDQRAKLLGPAVQALGGEAARRHAGAVRDLRGRLEARARSVLDQIRHPEPRPLSFAAARTVRLTGFGPTVTRGEATLAEVRAAGDRQYEIRPRADGPVVASWRKTVLLAKGRYRLQAIAHARKVEVPESDAGAGVRLRVEGGPAGAALRGHQVAKTVAVEFEVTDPAAEVELVAELAASSGSAAFSTASFRLSLLGS
jgi:spore coat protein H